MKPLLSKAIAEALGSLAIVFFGCGSVAVATDLDQATLLSFVPIVFGLTVCLMIYAVGHISGAHFNPAVTLAFASIGRFPWKELPVYWLAQFFGGVLGCFLLWLFIPDISTFATTLPAISSPRALGAEMVFSFFLMFVITSVATDSRAVGFMAGAAIGITVMVNAFLGGPLTGASMNPARSLGPALFEGQLASLWIYFVGPFAGAFFGAQLYRLIRCEDVKPTDSDAKGCC